MVSSASPLDLSVWGEGVAEALARLDAQSEALIARTMEWSGVNSGSYEPDGLARMRALLQQAFAVLPGAIELVPLAPSTRLRADGGEDVIEHGAAIRVRVRPEAPLQVALTGHYDTVFPASHGFQKPWREGPHLRGPGVADMKGGLVLMLAALEAFEALPGEKPLGYEILLSPDEEIGSEASGPLLAELGARAHMGMVYEPAPADGSLIGARKGSGNFSLVFKGRGAHVGRAFDDGRNAVVAAARAALGLDGLNGARAGVTFNVAALDGGSAPNVVPENAVLRFNVRAPAAEDAAWAQGEIARIAAEADGRGEVSARLHGAFTRPPKPANAGLQKLMGWTARAGAQLGLELKFTESGGVCEGNNLAAAGCANIDTLGPRGGALHTDGEFAIIDSFAERAKLSLLLLAGAARGVFDVRELRS